MEHHQRETETPEVKPLVKLNKLSIPTAIVIAGVLIVGAVFFGMKNNNGLTVNIP